MQFIDALCLAVDLEQQSRWAYTIAALQIEQFTCYAGKLTLAAGYLCNPNWPTSQKPVS